jgi:hypothetical protein
MNAANIDHEDKLEPTGFEPAQSRELTAAELAHVSGAIIAVLISPLLSDGKSSTNTYTGCSPNMQPHCPGYR